MRLLPIYTKRRRSTVYRRSLVREIGATLVQPARLAGDRTPATHTGNGTQEEGEADEEENGEAAAAAAAATAQVIDVIRMDIDI